MGASVGTYSTFSMSRAPHGIAGVTVFTVSSLSHSSRVVGLSCAYTYSMAATSPGRIRSNGSLPQRATRKPPIRTRPAIRAASGARLTRSRSRSFAVTPVRGKSASAASRAAPGRANMKTRSAISPPYDCMPKPRNGMNVRTSSDRSRYLCSRRRSQPQQASAITPPASATRA